MSQPAPRAPASFSTLPEDVLRIIAQKLTEHDFPTYHLGLPPPCDDLLALSLTSSKVRAATMPVLFGQRVCIRCVDDIDAFMSKWGHLAASISTASLVISSGPSSLSVQARKACMLIPLHEERDGPELADVIDVLEKLSSITQMTLTVKTIANSSSVTRRLVQHKKLLLRIRKLDLILPDDCYLVSVIWTLCCSFPYLSDLRIATKAGFKLDADKPIERCPTLAYLTHLRLGPCLLKSTQHLIGSQQWKQIRSLEAHSNNYRHEGADRLPILSELQSLIINIPPRPKQYRGGGSYADPAPCPIKLQDLARHRSLSLLHVRASNDFTLSEALLSVPKTVKDLILEGNTVKHTVQNFLTLTGSDTLKATSLRTVTCLCSDYYETRDKYFVDVLVYGFAAYGVKLRFGAMLRQVEV